MSFEANQAVFGFFGHCHPYKDSANSYHNVKILVIHFAAF